jgi:hypothetical protein
MAALILMVHRGKTKNQLVYRLRRSGRATDEGRYKLGHREAGVTIAINRPLRSSRRTFRRSQLYAVDEHEDDNQDDYEGGILEA